MTLATVLIALGLMPLFHEDKPVTPEKSEQMSAVAVAVFRAAKTPDEAAFLISWGDAETKFSLRIHAGRCKPSECDRGRARGVWQGHRNGLPDADWERMHGVEHTQFQAEEAARRVRWALRQCPNDRIRGAFRVLGGLGCAYPLKGENERVAQYRKVRAKL